MMNTSNRLMVSTSSGMACIRRSAMLRAPEELVLALHRRTELEVRVLGQETIDRPILRPQLALQVQHANPRLHHHRHGRPLVVFLDPLVGQRLCAHRVRVAAFLDGPELERDLLRCSAVPRVNSCRPTSTPSSSSTTCTTRPVSPAASIEPAILAMLFSESRSGQSIAATRTSRNDASLRRPAPTPTVCTTMFIFGAISSGLRAELWRPSESMMAASTRPWEPSLAAAVNALDSEVRLALRRAGQVLNRLHRPRRFGELDQPQLEVAAEPLPPFVQLPDGLVVAGHAGLVVGDAHRSRRIDQKDERGPLLMAAVVTQYRPEQQQHHQEDSCDPQQQERGYHCRRLSMPYARR